MGSVIQIGEDQVPGALAALDLNLRRAVAKGALAAAHRGRALMVKRTPIDQGTLRAGWRVTGGGAAAESNFGGELAQLGNTSPYLPIVELGARPHTVSPEGWQAIYEWVRRHHRGGELGGTGRMRSRPRGGTTGPFMGPDPVIAEITNAIVRKIAKVGQKATLFVKNSLPDLAKIAQHEISRAIAAVRADKGTP